MRIKPIVYIMCVHSLKSVYVIIYTYAYYTWKLPAQYSCPPDLQFNDESVQKQPFSTPPYTIYPAQTTDCGVWHWPIYGCRRTSTQSGEAHRWDRSLPRRTGAHGLRSNWGPERASSVCKPDRTRVPRKPARTSEPPGRYCSENERTRLLEITIRFRYLFKKLI